VTLRCDSPASTQTVDFNEDFINGSTLIDDVGMTTNVTPDNTVFVDCQVAH
jgi:hypothetical protein